MNKAVLYLLIGYPGAGKTTVASYICNTTGATHIWTDQERAKMFDHPTHSAEESQQLYDHLNQLTGELLNKGDSVVFDTSFNFYKDRQLLRQLAEAAGAEVKLIHMTTPKALAKERALHGSHAERNGMPYAMTPETFERIAGHLEAPHDDEIVIEIDGTNTDKAAALQLLGLGG